MSYNWQVGKFPGASGDLTTRNTGQSEGTENVSWTKGEHILPNGRGVNPPAGPTAEKTAEQSTRISSPPEGTTPITGASTNVPKPETAKKNFWCICLVYETAWQHRQI